MELELSRIADTLVQQCGIFQCDLEEGWNRYMHPFLTSQFSFEEVKDYIERKVEMAEKFDG